MKVCSRCGASKPPAGFCANPKKAGGLESWCKSCKNAYCKEWVRKFPEKDRLLQRRGHLKRAYGLSAESYESMICEQAGLCAICEGVMKSPCVDHNHQTGKVRALLCNSCNVMLGQAKDNPQILMRAVAYLEQHNQN